MIFTSTLKEELPMTSRRRPVVLGNVSLRTADGTTATGTGWELALHGGPASTPGRAR
jgi:hypothetical protein